MPDEKILIVEDEIVTAHSLELRLVKLGYKVLPLAGDAAEAWHILAEDTPDLIMMDIRLRGEVDGIQLAEQILAKMDIPIIYLTAHAEDETVQRATATAPYGYLLKPVDPSELRITLQTTLYKHKMEKQLKNSEERFRFITENMTDTVWLMDTNLKVTYISPSVTALRGYTLAELQEMRIDENLTPASLELVLATMGVEMSPDKLMDGNRKIVIPLELEFYKKDRTTFWSENTFTLIRDQQGMPYQILGVGRDITERKQHLRQNEAIAALSGALRDVQDRAGTLAVVLKEVTALLNPLGAHICLLDVRRNTLVIEVGEGIGAPMVNRRFLADKSLLARSLRATKPQIIEDFDSNPMIPEKMRTALSGVKLAYTIPLIVHGDVIGALMVFPRERIQKRDMVLLITLADFSASAIQRVNLFEQARQQVQRLEALHTIDKAITSITDINMTLSIFSDQVINLFGVDAVAIWLNNPVTHTLTLAHGRGFKVMPPLNTTMRLGRGISGQVALERQVTIIPNLAAGLYELSPSPIRWEQEQFVSYIGAPLIAKGELKGILEIYSCTPISEDNDWLDFLEAISHQAAIAVDNSRMFVDLQRSNAELLQSYNAMLENLAQIPEKREPTYAGHSLNVADLSLRLARALDVDQGDMIHIYRGTLLHDLGTLAIPDAIIKKPGKLNEEEWALVKKHPTWAHEWFSRLNFVKSALNVPYCHHERWDGSGYPRGLKGTNIPIEARIAAVADVWDALTHDRPYRKAWKAADAQEYVSKQSGKLFDPQVVQVFLKMTK
jgi:PAS domain S-box-containing protein